MNVSILVIPTARLTNARLLVLCRPVAGASPLWHDTSINLAVVHELVSRSGSEEQVECRTASSSADTTADYLGQQTAKAASISRVEEITSGESSQRWWPARPIFTQPTKAIPGSLWKRYFGMQQFSASRNLRSHVPAAGALLCWSMVKGLKCPS